MKRLLFAACFILFGLVSCAVSSGSPASEPAIESTTATTAEPILEAATDEPTSEPTDPTAVPTQLPEPTKVLAEAPAIPTPPVRETVDNLTAVSADAIAYVQEDQLFIRTLPDGEPVTVYAEPCPEGSFCTLRYLKWSPDGQHLLFYVFDGTTSRLQVSDLAGAVQTVAEDTFYVLPGDWSPDGRTVAYMRPTGDYTQPTDEQPGGPVMGVWTVDLSQDGVIGTPEMVGIWQAPDGGCGGGGRSISDVLYENEGGTSYGYLMAVLEWTAQDILLYTTNCTNIGIGRFDMATGTELPGFDRPLRNLVLNPAGDRWFAVTGYDWQTQEGGSETDGNQLVTGTPDSTEVTVIPTSAPVELVFAGQHSGTLYYTERNSLGGESMDEKGMYFSFFASALWRIQPDGNGEERLLYGADHHSYAQVTETAAGDLIFVLVENERPLFEAAQFPELDEEALQAYYPQRHIMQLAASGGEPSLILSNAGQPTVSLP